MRSLIQHDRDEDDRGAVVVWVAIMIVVLLGAGALVIDVGALRVERRELQNGADAAALAVAIDCANGDCLDEMATAETYADDNARDDAAKVDEVCGSGTGLADTTCVNPPAGTAGATGWVQVSTSTDNPANSNRTQVKFLLAPVLNALNKGSTVKASAAAAWGPLGAATTLPVTFSLCEFKNLGGSLDPLTFPEGENYIYLHGATPPPDGPGYGDCPSSPSGQDGPGGFGWLDPVQGCTAPVTVGGWAGGDTGRSEPCDLDLQVDEEVLIPLYDETRGQGSGLEYHIAGFVGIQILKYRFQNDNAPQSFNRCETQVVPRTQLSGNVDCVYGKFTRVTTTADGFGGGTDYGARAIKMIG